MINEAANRIKAGELVAFPTETVYGLGADASNPLAVRQIFALKGRPADHPLIVHLADASQLDAWAHATPLAHTLAQAFWPGPLTLVLKRRETVLDEVTGGLDTIGIRVPRHPMARALLSQSGCGIAAPSANRFGRVSPTRADHVRTEFGDQVFILDGGPCDVGIESTIIDLSGAPALLRPGGIPPEAISEITGPLGSSKTIAPGTLASHYAPKTSLLLCDDADKEAARLRARGLNVAILRATDLRSHAQNLYAQLRILDQDSVDILVAERATNQGLGLAINDRLARAATPPDSKGEGST